MTPSLVLHNNFLSFVIHSSCVSCLSFLYLCSYGRSCVVGAEWVHTTWHYSCHKDPVQLHSSPQSSAKTGRYLLTTWRHLETRWIWAFSHIRQNDSSIFYYSFITYLAPSCNFLSSGICPSFHFLLCFSSCVLSTSLHSLPPKHTGTYWWFEDAIGMRGLWAFSHNGQNDSSIFLTVLLLHILHYLVTS